MTATTRSSTPTGIPIVFIKRPFFGVLPHQKGEANLLAEKPKARELQMDWLRTEDLKEEKNVTAPIAIIATR
jgi:hypothetical protein